MGARISTLFTARVLHSARVYGLDALQLARAANVVRQAEDFRPISEAKHLAVWAHLMRACRDPGFPIFYAEQVSIDDYGVLGLACKTAPRLGDALALVGTQLTAYTDALEVQVTRTAAVGRLTVRRAGPLTLGRRVSTESTLAELCAAMRSITAAPVVPLSVTFRHRRFEPLDQHARFFGVTPSFGAREDALELRSGDLDLPVTRRDPALFTHLCAELTRLTLAARREGRGASLSERAGDEVTRLFPSPPRVSPVARALGLSERSLQRHLEREGTTFAAVTEAARRSLADAMLADGGWSVAEVADALGFADPASFSRAFRRWRGSPPSRRRRQRSGARRSR